MDATLLNICLWMQPYLTSIDSCIQLNRGLGETLSEGSSLSISVFPAMPRPVKCTGKCLVAIMIYIGVNLCVFVSESRR